MTTKTHLLSDRTFDFARCRTDQDLSPLCASHTIVASLSASFVRTVVRVLISWLTSKVEDEYTHDVPRLTCSHIVPQTPTLLYTASRY